MEDDHPLANKQISSEDWESTPPKVKRLLEVLDTKFEWENVSRLSQFLEATPVGIAVHDSTGKLVYVNRVGKELLGISEIPNAGIWELPETFQVYRSTTRSLYPVAELPSNLALAGTSITVDDVEIHRDNHMISLEVSAAPIFDPQGKIIYAIATFQDISDRQRQEIKRRQAEEALRESEARFRNMAENVPGVIIRYLLRVDGSDAILYMSPNCYTLWGVSAEAAEADVGLLWRLINPEDVPSIYQSILESAQTLQPWHWQWRILTPQGQKKWLEAYGRPERQPNGDVIWDTLILDVSDRQKVLVALQESEQRFRQLFELTPKIAVQGYNSQRQVIYWNQASELLYGYTKAEAIGQKLEELIIPPEMRQQVIADIQNWLDQQESILPSELNLVRKDGSAVAVYSSHLMLTNTLNEREMYCVDIDLTELKQAEVARRESEARYRLLAENMRDLVCLHAPNGRYLYVSPSCESLLGYHYSEMLGQEPYTFLHPDERDLVYEEINIYVCNGKPLPITHRMRQKSGNYIWFETLINPILGATGEVVQLQSTSRDVTERVKVQNRLQHDALHDALTGLPNRNLLMERLELALQRSRRLKHYCFAVLFLDLDRFKVINDSLGHLIGDQLLIAIAQKLKSILRETDLVCRLGGDEFVILLDEIKDIQETIRVAERIFTLLRSPFQISGREVYLTTSIGITLGNANYLEASHLLRDADIAMYRAKNQGKARCEIFDAEMYAQAIARLHLENDLRLAIDKQEFVLYYQPIVALDSCDLVGFEVLVRWPHPSRGLVSPVEFIPLAEEIGLIHSLSCFVMLTACRQVVAWQHKFDSLSKLKFSINLSIQDLRRENISEEISEILSQTGLNASCLTLEITEGMLIDNIESTINLLNTLKARGIQVSIDDFGTGYSSLNYLHCLPIDSLKIDRSFVSKMQENPRNYQIVETIVTLSERLAIDVIAEGIETVEQLENLKTIGCRFGQGYLFSPPLSSPEIESFLASSCRSPTLKQ